jgi:hypothetical protein
MGLIDQQHPNRCTESSADENSESLCKNWDRFYGGCKLMVYHHWHLGNIQPRINSEKRWIIEKVGCVSWEGIE